LLKPQLRCALHFVSCTARLHFVLFFISAADLLIVRSSRRFANCATCSLADLLIVRSARLLLDSR